MWLTALAHAHPLLHVTQVAEGVDGLCHISQLADEHVESVGSVVSVGIVSVGEGGAEGVSG